MNMKIFLFITIAVLLSGCTSDNVKHSTGKGTVIESTTPPAFPELTQEEQDNCNAELREDLRSCSFVSGRTTAEKCRDKAVKNYNTCMRYE